MEKVFIINELNCAHCGAKIEEALGKLEGIESAVLNFPMRTIKIHGEVTDETLRRMNETARSIEPDVKIVPKEHHHREHHHHEHHHEAHEHTHAHEHVHSQHEESSIAEILPLIGGIVLFAAAIVLGHFAGQKALSLAVYAAAYLVLGANILTAAAQNIRRGNFFDENTLMTIATLGAFAIGEYAEAVGVVLFFRIGEMFEDFAVTRSRKAITAAAALRVEEAEVLIDGAFTFTDADEIEAGDLLRIKTGERIAADGIVESGESRIDTSAVNGEPVPMTVRPGDRVLSGCINLGDTFTLRTESAASESMLAKLASAVEDASAAKPKIDRFITRFAKIYTPIVIAAAVLTATVPSLITGEWTKWIHSALTFLVISCPCALVLSVPLAYFSGIGAASKLGILFKGGDSVEALGKVKVIAFDKTGTITDGSFSVTGISTFGSLSESELLRLCGSCEQTSTHPVAQSIVERCRQDGLTLDTPEKSGELAGRGISADLGGKSVLCGNERLMSEKGIELPEVEKAAGSVVYIAVNGKAEGRIVVSDKLKKTAASAVSGLRKAGIKTALFTGDKPENAEITAQKLGIGTALGGLLPDGKLEALSKLREQYGPVMFVGDGINDGPVLAGADVGGAMQSGSDLALEAADAIFMNSEPESVLRAKRIADTALKTSYFNIAFALAVKAAVLVLGLIGHPSMWFAVFADSGVAMLLVLNSVRILNTKKYI
ncbi:MAG: cadmium-translocating P-type ATPase [Ruminococcus sp.]|nr:cadmium-translocating P-type ATPase [Ruminococcus sp.]